MRKSPFSATVVPMFRAIVCASFLPVAAVFAGSQDTIPLETGGASVETRTPLTLGNLFSEGWDQPWSHVSDPDAAPDMALLRVQTNFLEREFRFDFYSQQNPHNLAKRDVEFVDGLVAYSFNRRIMIEAVGNYEWDDYRVGRDRNGGDGAFLGRLQLVDVPGASYAFSLRVTPPNDGIGGEQTNASFALAGWHDLTPLGLPRVGLYFHVQEETYIGPGVKGAKRNDMTYDISLAKTWVKPGVPVVGNFTTFVEGYGTTNLDGDKWGSTMVTITPGFRTTLWHNNVLMGGVDIPVTGPRPFDAIFRLTYIINF